MAKVPSSLNLNMPHKKRHTRFFTAGLQAASLKVEYLKSRLLDHCVLRLLDFAGNHLPCKRTAAKLLNFLVFFKLKSGTAAFLSPAKDLWVSCTTYNSMKKCVRLIWFVAFLLLSAASVAQDTLPRFSVRNIGNNRIILGWTNQFPTIKQISIQRSHDSLRNYKTILSVADPKAVTNGYADTKAPNDHMFYRLFYVLEGGTFYFTEAKRPKLDTAKAVVAVVEPPKADTPVAEKPKGFVPSSFVFTNRNGYVHINLPDANKKDYSIKFFEEDDSFLFELKNIKEKAMILDKANFVHAGWFIFELYNDEKLVERHKFYLPKDF
jgi:hypothetical protein